METLWFFRLRFRRAYDSAYDSDFWFSKGHKRSHDYAYDSDSDFAASLNQALIAVKTLKSLGTPTEIRLPSKQRFLSRMAFSIYEVVCVACQSHLDWPLSRLFEAGMKEAVIFLRIRSHKPRMWKVQVATRVEKLVGELMRLQCVLVFFFVHRWVTTLNKLRSFKIQKLGCELFRPS